MSALAFTKLELAAVSRQFKGVTALADFSLTIRNGEFVALLGPSGCGKSTTLNCLAGLLPLTAGAIYLDDERVDLLPPERRGFGMVFQNYALFPHMSVRKNIAFGLQMQRVSRREIVRKVDWALDLIHLTEHGDKRPNQLSGGQQQRVAIARAIVMEPKLVLMDEPLSNLDAKLRHEMRTELRRLHRELNLTTVYVTHDQEEALSLADRLVVLRNGRMQQAGAPEEVYARPANAFVADFMGYRNQLSMVAGPVEGDPKLTRLSGGGIELVANGTVRGQATVAIRPDGLTLGRTGVNDIPGVVRTVEYQGRDYEIEIEVNETTSLFARINQRVTAGDQVVVNVPRDHVMVYAAGADPEADESRRDPIHERETV